MTAEKPSILLAVQRGQFQQIQLQSHLQDKTSIVQAPLRTN